MEKRKKKNFRSHKNPIQVMQIFASYKIESNEFIQKHLLWDELRSCKRFTFNEQSWMHILHMNDSRSNAFGWHFCNGKLISLIELNKHINYYHVNDAIPKKFIQTIKIIVVIIRIWIEWKIVR